MKRSGTRGGAVVVVQRERGTESRARREWPLGDDERALMMELRLHDIFQRRT